METSAQELNNEQVATLREKLSSTEKMAERLESKERESVKEKERFVRRIESLEAQVISMSQSFEKQEGNYEVSWIFGFLGEGCSDFLLGIGCGDLRGRSVIWCCFHY